jgi:hypothetical protein
MAQRVRTGNELQSDLFDADPEETTATESANARDLRLD